MKRHVQSQPDAGDPGAVGAPTDSGGAGDSPGLPGLSTWGAVYLLVFAVFVFVVVGLAVFTRVYA